LKNLYQNHLKLPQVLLILFEVNNTGGIVPIVSLITISAFPIFAPLSSVTRPVEVFLLVSGIIIFPQKEDQHVSRFIPASSSCCFPCRAFVDLIALWSPYGISEKPGILSMSPYSK